MANYNKVNFNYLPQTNWESYSGTDNPFMPWIFVVNDYKHWLALFGTVFVGSLLLSPYLVAYMPGNALFGSSFLAGTYSVIGYYFLIYNIKLM
jgi:hypothetical protein